MDADEITELAEEILAEIQWAVHVDTYVIARNEILADIRTAIRTSGIGRE